MTEHNLSYYHTRISRTSSFPLSKAVAIYFDKLVIPAPVDESWKTIADHHAEEAIKQLQDKAKPLTRKMASMRQWETGCTIY